MKCYIVTVAEVATIGYDYEHYVFTDYDKAKAYFHKIVETMLNQKDYTKEAIDDLLEDGDDEFFSDPDDEWFIRIEQGNLAEEHNMKYYYGDSMKEAMMNEPVEIKTTDELEAYRQNYWVVIPASDVDDECDCEEGQTKILVTFDTDNQNLQQEFESQADAYRYAKDNILNLPCVTKCWQSDLDTDLGYGDDYEETDITQDDDELAEMLDQYV